MIRTLWARPSGREMRLLSERDAILSPLYSRLSLARIRRDKVQIGQTEKFIKATLERYTWLW